MKIEVLNTGTELLLGTTVNTHGGWFGQQLFTMGLRVLRQTTVPDGDAIREALEEIVLRADVVLITGGLGPTSDDLTREIVAETLGLEMVKDEQALRTLEGFFTSRGRKMAPANLKQAMVPCGADVLPNPNGTAPGLYLPPRLNGRSSCAVFMLPGPPRELYPMYHAEVEPRLRALCGVENVPEVVSLKFTGIGESDFHHGIDDDLMAMEGLEHGYCARMGELDLRLIGDAEVIGEAKGLVLERFAKYLISDDGSSMEGTVVRILTEMGKTLALAESCTGGYISHRVTNVPGSSAVFTHGWVTYANEAKTGELGVPEAVIAENGAVSEETARAMAEGALRESGADYALAITGIAGPSGGTEEKPAGTAWLGLAMRDGDTAAKKIYHPRQREDFKDAASQSALEMLRRALVG